MTRVSRLSPSFVRITLGSPELAHFSDRGLDQRIKIAFPLPDTGLATFPSDGRSPADDDWSWWHSWRELPVERRNPLRTYTARSIRRDRGEIDVDFVSHGDAGPASAWAGAASIGDEIIVIGPDARSGLPPMGIEWNPGDASTLLLAGDETALPAIAAILEQLPRDATGCVFVEVPTRADILPLLHPDGIAVNWLPRDTASVYGDRLIEGVRDWVGRYLTARHHGMPVDERTLTDLDVDHDILWEVPTGSPAGDDLYAFFAGEASAITTLRRSLVSEIGIDRQQVAFMGYWRLGKAEN